MNAVLSTSSMHDEPRRAHVGTTFLLRELRELREAPIRKRLARLRRVMDVLEERDGRLAAGRWDPRAVWGRAERDAWDANRAQMARPQLEIDALEAMLRRGARGTVGSQVTAGSWVKKEKKIMRNASTNNDTTIDLYEQRIAAMKDHVCGARYQIPVTGQVLTPARVVRTLEDCLRRRTAVADALAAYKAALAERDEGDARFRGVDDALKNWVLNTFGAGSTEAKAFGYEPRKMPTRAVAPVEMTPAVNAPAAGGDA